MAEAYLQRQLKLWRKDHPFGFVARPRKTDNLVWECGVPGPTNSAWRGKLFAFDLKFSEDYPEFAPEVLAVTAVEHPNVDEDGRISVPRFREEWNERITIKEILETIQDLLVNPSLERRFRENQQAYFNYLYDKTSKILWSIIGVNTREKNCSPSVLLSQLLEK